MSTLFLILFGFVMLVFGIILCPFILFIRARRDKHWDDSNMTNIFRLVAHIATHPGDFGEMYYADGRKPFWYIAGDEFADIVQTRPDLPKNDVISEVEQTINLESGIKKDREILSNDFEDASDYFRKMSWGDHVKAEDLLHAISREINKDRIDFRKIYTQLTRPFSQSSGER